MSGRPILFSGPMVRAILDGRKTQTRRTRGLEDANDQPDAWESVHIGPLDYMTKPRSKGKFGATFKSKSGAIEPGTVHICPQVLPYAVGDRLWAKEAWAPVPASAYRMSDGVEQTSDPSDPDRAAVYRCGWERCAPSRWRSPIHMPRWASRLTLTVTDVRVQRVQEISEEDARAEGLEWVAPTYGVQGLAESWTADPRQSFRGLWDSLNAKRGFGWDVNPWVLALTFTAERRGGV